MPMWVAAVAARRAPPAALAAALAQLLLAGRSLLWREGAGGMHHCLQRDELCSWGGGGGASAWHALLQWRLWRHIDCCWRRKWQWGCRHWAVLGAGGRGGGAGLHDLYKCWLRGQSGLERRGARHV